MKTSRRTRSRERLFALSAAVIVYLGFVASSSLPGFVICHRPDGHAAVEIAGPDAPCSCCECEHRLERLAETQAGRRAEGAVLEVGCCPHEPILAATEGSALRCDDGLRTTEPAGSVSPPPVSFVGGKALFIEPPASEFSRPVLPPLAKGTLDLRC